MTRYIGVAAYSGPPTPEAYTKAVEFVDEVSKKCHDVVLVLGGYRGLMKVVVDRALERKIRVMLIIPRDYEGEEYPEGVLVVRTGMDVKGRSAILVRTSDVLVCLGGASGTLTEVLMAYGLGRKVVVVLGTGLPTDRLRPAYPDGVLDERLGLRLVYVQSGAEAAERACKV